MKHALIGAPIVVALILTGTAWAQSPAPATPPAAAATPPTPAPTTAGPMAPAKPAPTAQAAVPAKPQAKQHLVRRRRVYHYRDTEESADTLNGEELRQSPVVTTTTTTMTPVPAPMPLYPAPAYYPPPAPWYYPPAPVPYYPPPIYMRPY